MSKDQRLAVAGIRVPGRRRTYTAEQRRQMVAETLLPGASVSVVARRHDVNTNLLFKWRQRHGKPTDGKAVLLPVRMAEPGLRVETPRRARASARAAGWIEIDFAGGPRVRIHGAADARTVRHVLRNLAR